jgi:dTDP-4-dehydrorhamnose reductase
MLEKGLQGLYHVVSSECTSKYDFGVRLARQFDFDETLIEPTSIARAGLVAPRSPNLSLDSSKLAQDLGESPPDLNKGLERFHAQYLSGYPEFIRQMGI